MKKRQNIRKKKLNLIEVLLLTEMTNSWLDSFDPWLLLCLWIHHQAISFLGQGGPKHKPPHRFTFSFRFSTS